MKCLRQYVQRKTIELNTILAVEEQNSLDYPQVKQEHDLEHKKHKRAIYIEKEPEQQHNNEEKDEPFMRFDLDFDALDNEMARDHELAFDCVGVDENVYEWLNNVELLP
jgi:hypothetical protein